MNNFGCLNILLLYFNIKPFLITPFLATSVYHFSASAPYRWQFKEEDSPSWGDFGPYDNDALERLYCKVENLEVDVVLEDTAMR